MNEIRVAWQVGRIGPEATHALRRAVLRGGRADAAVSFPDDAAPGALHLGVWAGDPERRPQGSHRPGEGDVAEPGEEPAGAPIGVASFLPAPAPDALLVLLGPAGAPVTTGAPSAPPPDPDRVPPGPAPVPGPDHPSGSSSHLPTLVFQLRGMAVSSRWQGSGAGSALLRHGLDVLEASGATLVWANGRDPALAFYRRHGFVVLGDGFLGAEGVPHHWIARRLGRLR